MKVIARSKGPKYKNFEPYETLEIGKEYEVFCFSLHDGNRWNDIYDVDNFIIPKEPKFYIDILVNGEKKTFWNDYFYSTEELRKLKLEKLK